MSRADVVDVVDVVLLIGRGRVIELRGGQGRRQTLRAVDLPLGGGDLILEILVGGGDGGFVAILVSIAGRRLDRRVDLGLGGPQLLIYGDQHIYPEAMEV